jgi:hypothetical protein
MFTHLIKILRQAMSSETLAPSQFPFDDSVPTIDCPDCEHEAIVTQEIVSGKAGQVKFRASWWSARSDQDATFLAGDLVYVIGRLNATTLYVKALPISFSVACLPNAVASIDCHPKFIEKKLAGMIPPA